MLPEKFTLEIGFEKTSMFYLGAVLGIFIVLGIAIGAAIVRP
jgi:hypothetical protein